MSHDSHLDRGPTRERQGAAAVLATPGAAAPGTVAPDDQAASVYLSKAETAQLLVPLFAEIPAFAFRAVGTELALTAVGPNLEKLIGWTAAEVIGAPAWWASHVHPEDRQIAREAHERARAEGRTRWSFEWRVAHRAGGHRWFDVSVHRDPSPAADPDQFSGYAVDITERKQAEAATRQGEARYHALLTAAQRQVQDAELLERVRAAIARELDLAAIIRLVVEAIVEALGYTQVSIYRLEAGCLWLQHQVGYDHVIECIPIEQGVAGRTARTGVPVLIKDVGAERHFLGAIDGITSEICVPLVDEGRVAGILNIESTTGVALDEGDLRLLIAVTEHLNHAIGRARLYAEARESERRYRSVVENAREIIFQSTADGIWTFLNPAWTETLGFAVAASLGRPIIEFIHPDDRESCLELFRPLYRGEVEHCRHEFRWLAASGEERWLEVQARPTRDGEGRLAGVAGTLSDITPRKRLEAQLIRQAFHDALTGLPNRILFMDRLRQSLTASGRARGQIAVLFLDLDGFKVINDSLGHGAGDELLRAVGDRIAACIRTGDTIARFGGDEFAILVERVDRRATAVRLAERIVRALRAPLIVGGREMFVSASVGVTFRALPAAEASADELVREADIALYQAKAAGKARVAVFNREMNTRAVERLNLEMDLRRALQGGELQLFYQPEVDLARGTIRGVEALIRWRHPERGLLGPADFIPLAEDAGLILPLDHWALETAMSEMRGWHRGHTVTCPLVLSVNVSARQFSQDDLVPGIAALLDRMGMDPGCLQIEITETVVMEDVEHAERTLRSLEALGVRVAIDDFGMGYSSLSYLRRFPADMLKIDRSFVHGLERDEATLAIVHAISELGHALGMQVTAEGIETLANLNAVRAAGCDRGQGYYFARPLPAAEICQLLENGLVVPAVHVRG